MQHLIHRPNFEAKMDMKDFSFGNVKFFLSLFDASGNMTGFTYGENTEVDLKNMTKNPARKITTVKKVLLLRRLPMVCLMSASFCSVTEDHGPMSDEDGKDAVMAFLSWTGFLGGSIIAGIRMMMV
jgi:hypothetical protein